MPVRSIVDIDINDKNFQNYMVLWNRYQGQLRQQPAVWQKFNQQIQGTKKSFEAIVADQIAMMARTKMIAAAQAEAERRTRTTADRWREMAQSSKAFAGNISRATHDMLRWGALGAAISGIAGIGGLFGMERLGQHVTAGRQFAGGLGADYGQARAFGLNFGRFVGDPAGMLGNVSTALHDVTSRAYVGLLGAGISQQFLQSRNAAEVSVELLQRIPELFKGTPRHLIGARLSALNLDQILSREDVTRYLAAKPDERQRQLAAYGGDVSGLGLDPLTQRKWNDFTTQLERAGSTIGTVLVRGLTGLTTPIENLSKSVTKTVESFLGSPKIKDAIDSMGPAIERFAQYIGTKEFQEGVANFAEGVVLVGKALVKVARWIVGGPSEWVKPTEPHQFEMLEGAAKLQRERAEGKATALGQLGRIFSGSGSMTESGLLNMIRGLERSGDAAVSPAGAIGRYQIMPGTARQYGFDPNRLTDPAYNEQVARAILKDLIRRYSGNVDEILAAYNAGPGRADRFRQSGHDVGGLPRETQGYLGRAHGMGDYRTTVRIENQTGGSATVSTTQAGL